MLVQKKVREAKKDSFRQRSSKSHGAVTSYDEEIEKLNDPTQPQMDLRPPLVVPASPGPISTALSVTDAADAAWSSA